ncbi:MAG TPA: UDP-N-acetylglucosamine 2-epimerase (non-hydrolyzing) [Candidatus Paceibacterota bacterium]|nr:UDP-N-acetylglucosamine 2-epimerase (non-hydrolyzing) [Candidatus Pacearchaeota archaeon]HRZ50677.1 UDP-N-acetylglucosamine 2-epimerase (non-hydrolyzing) [Candidatus Paceibacterota bacterium]HSA36426.1 UDP-N-acetylglucosamine 2-epimerase (non-hydrolyzing) [Candidatus Paceibacterota bacterium]
MEPKPKLNKLKRLNKLKKLDGLKPLVLVGARPNFIKIAPLFWELKNHPGIKPVLVHTGQHYDFEMSQAFFHDLDIPKPDYNLGIGSGTHGAQTGLTMIEFEKIVAKEAPNVVIVVGDVNSTLAGALVAKKMHIAVAHIEAGLRSFDMDMPEEVNRVLTDHISDYLFCPTKTAVSNLKKEGIVKNVFNVGDIMYDILKIKEKELKPDILGKLSVKSKEYLLLTIHRASNADNPENLKKIIGAVLKIKEKVVFPVHPRTRVQIVKLVKFFKPFKKLKTLNELNELNQLSTLNGLTNILFTEPVGYMEMLALEKNAKRILTDSGGVQKEAFWLKVPCITLRDETEWVETLSGGWNVLAGTDEKKTIQALNRSFPRGKQGFYYGDGHTAGKIIRALFK